MRNCFEEVENTLRRKIGYPNLLKTLKFKQI